MNILSGGANRWLAHPHSGGRYFATIPFIEHNFGVVAGGPVELRIGRYRQFGLNHIWFRHQREILQHFGCSPNNMTAGDMVALTQKYVADIITPGIPIHCEFAEIDGNHKVQVLRSKAGVAILQPKPHADGMVYSVTSAYKKGYAEGSRIGILAPPPGYK